MLHLKVHKRFSFRECFSMQRKCEKDTFTVAVDDLLGAIKAVTDVARKRTLNDLSKDTQEATMKFEGNQNILNILDFQLLLLIFNPFNHTSH